MSESMRTAPIYDDEVPWARCDDCFWKMEVAGGVGGMTKYIAEKCADHAKSTRHQVSLDVVLYRNMQRVGSYGWRFSVRQYPDPDCPDGGLEEYFSARASVGYDRLDEPAQKAAAQ